MAEIVFAAGAPHAPGLIGLLEAAPADVKDVVTTTYRNLADAIALAKADVLIVFANDHLANSRVRAYPDFLIGMAAEHRGPFEWFKPWIGCEEYTVKGSPEVAAALFLSPKTVEHHLGSVFRKRGYRSRAELAASFAQGPSA